MKCRKVLKKKKILKRGKTSTTITNAGKTEFYLNFE